MAVQGGYLVVDGQYCCSHSLTVDTVSWTNLTPALLSQAQQAPHDAWLECSSSSETSSFLRTVTNSSSPGDGSGLYTVPGVSRHDLHNVSMRWQSREDLLKEYLGDRHISLEAVVLLTAIYALIFLSGVLGNVCTCVVIARNRSMHTATNYYLFSLAVSDVLTLLLGSSRMVSWPVTAAVTHFISLKPSSQTGENDDHISPDSAEFRLFATARQG
ncbi:hypothetical protein ACOMHN_046144 [Nucella lapillus]